jgi:transcriptional regulator with XRE-family HTH domain
MTLAEYMSDTGLTDSAIADAIGVSRPYVTKLRLRKRTPSMAVAVAIEELSNGRVPASSLALRPSAGMESVVGGHA